MKTLTLTHHTQTAASQKSASSPAVAVVRPVPVQGSPSRRGTPAPGPAVRPEALERGERWLRRTISEGDEALEIALDRLIDHACIELIESSNEWQHGPQAA